MKTITILSGKGGVGKSSITASLAVALSRSKKIICTDCDVDASNLSLVLGAKRYEEWDDISTNEKAVFDLEKCNSCGRCFDACYFNAIRMNNGKPELKEFSCEGCGACKLVCPKDAIRLERVNNAKLGYANTRYGFKVISAQLNMGESGSGKVVSEVRRKASEIAEDSDIMLIDSAAGIGCPVIASVTGSDYCIVVTEPTPSGFSDMRRAIKIINHFRIPYSIIINKHDLNSEFTKNIEQFAKENDAPVIAKIPYDKLFAKALVNLTPIIEYAPSFENIFMDISNNVIKELS